MIISLLLLCGLAAAAPGLQTVCNANPYGRPNSWDCSALLQSFAPALDDAIRIFDEEQLAMTYDGSWPGIVNPFKTKVVQVPKLWTHAGCNLALMSYASPRVSENNTLAEDVVSRVGATSWKNVFHGVAVLLDECLVQRKTGGAVIVLSALLPKRPILTIFAYERDSYFETIWNDYQNHPHGVRPIDPKILSGNESVIALNDVGSNAGNVSTA